RRDGEMAPEQRASLNALVRTVSLSVNGSQPDAHDSGPLLGRADDGADKLVGRAVGACFARAPSTRLLDAAAGILRSDAGWRAFSAAAADEVRSDPARLAALEACLEGLVHAFTWAPRRIVYAHRDNMCALVERFRQQPRLDDVWPSPHFRIILVKHEPAFDVLRLSDPAGFLRMLDRFPHPEPSRHILAYSSDRSNLADLLGLLELARPCFDGGTWLPWIKAPVLVLAAVEQNLAALADAGCDDGFLPSKAFASAAEKVVSAVLERADGNDLGHAWLQRLMHRGAFRVGHGVASDRPSIWLQDLILELASALSMRRDALPWIRTEHETWRRDRAVAAISAAGLGEVGSQSMAATLVREVLGLGLHTTGQEDGFAASSNAERRLMAAVIGRHPDPAAWFEELWRSMAPIRDQARHTTMSAGGHAGDATVIAVTWFMFGLDAVDPRSSAYRSLWRALLRAVRGCALAQTSLLAQPAWRARYQLLAAHLAHRLGDAADEAAADDLRELLAPLLCLDMTLPEVVHVLFDAGVAPSAIATAAGQTGRLVGLLRRLGVEQAWREGRQQEQLGRQSQFSQMIARMADAIEVQPSPQHDSDGG
ncbi:MAG: hypothetical protein RQ966_19795, partial [Acetobacteraceae bacterium]|nr:hypothetical protein [Acetobacteraceae bacterium]